MICSSGQVCLFIAFASTLIVTIGNANEPTKQMPPDLAALQGKWQFVPPPGTRSQIEAADDTKSKEAIGHFSRVFILQGNNITWENGGPTRFDEWSKKGMVTVTVSPRVGPTLYEELRASAAERGMSDDYATDLPRQVMIGIPFFKLIGLYKIDNEGRADFILRYLGQGVEGDFAKKWRPPLGFGKEEPDDCLRIQLRRMASIEKTRAKSQP